MPASPHSEQIARLDIMTFNLRYASASAPHSWAERRPVTRKLLRDEPPHLIGTQEGLYPQLRDIEQDLGAGYACIGTGREGGSHGEFVAIFYDTGRLAPLEYDHFWLSEAPDKIGSKDEFLNEAERPGSPRMVTWVRFGVRGTPGMFYALNTHLDNRSETARRRAATQLAGYLTDRLDPGLPRIVTGDFNAPAAAGTSVYDTMLNEGRYPVTICRCRPSSRFRNLPEDVFTTSNRLVPFYRQRYHGCMALNIKDPETERLAAEVAALTGNTKTGAIRYALRQVLQAKSPPSVTQREERLTRFLEEEIWPLIPSDQLGKPVSKAEREEILGFGQDGA